MTISSGTRPEHVARAKDLMRALIAAKLKKRWICQATINFADDEELLELAHRAGCLGAFIGFESPSKEGLAEIGKRYNIVKGTDPRGSVQRIHRHRIGVVGSYIMGLDCDLPGIGRQIADAALDCGVDMLSALYLTPLPGTRLWTDMEAAGRIAAHHYPQDWEYYTLGFPVAKYRHLSWPQMRAEMKECAQAFYTPGRIAARVWAAARQHRHPLAMLIGNLSYRWNYQSERRTGGAIDEARGNDAAGGIGETPAHPGIRLMRLAATGQGDPNLAAAAPGSHRPAGKNTGADRQELSCILVGAVYNAG